MKPLQPKYTYRFVCGVFMAALACGMFFFVWYRFVRVHNLTGSLLGKGNLGMALGLYIALYVYFGRLVRAFGFGVERKFATVAAQIIALLITDVAEVFLSLAITGQFRFFWSFTWRYFLLWCVQSVAIGLLTSLAINIYRKRFPPLQLLEIYGDYEDTFWQEVDSVDFKYHVKNRLHYSEGPFGPMLADYDAVLINNVPARPRNDILKLCFARNKRLYFVPKISDIIAGSADSIKLFDTPLYLCRNRGMSNLQWITKRFFDVVLSAAALIVLSPVFAVTALAIKLNDGGPVFYKQERVTKGGNVFNTDSTIEMAEQMGAKKYFCVSTDKAANPVNMMGASKRIMEMFLNRRSVTQLVSTARFANVAFSDGSLLYGFNRRIEKGQAFRIGDIYDLHRRALAAGITNSVASCTLMIEMGEQVYFSAGSEKNIKLTTVEDIDIFKALLAAKRSDWLKD